MHFRVWDVQCRVITLFYGLRLVIRVWCKSFGASRLVNIKWDIEVERNNTLLVKY